MKEDKGETKFDECNEGESSNPIETLLKAGRESLTIAIDQEIVKEEEHDKDVMQISTEVDEYDEGATLNPIEALVTVGQESMILGPIHQEILAKNADECRVQETGVFPTIKTVKDEEGEIVLNSRVSKIGNANMQVIIAMQEQLSYSRIQFNMVMLPSMERTSIWNLEHLKSCLLIIIKPNCLCLNPGYVIDHFDFDVLSCGSCISIDDGSNMIWDPGGTLWHLNAGLWVILFLPIMCLTKCPTQILLLAFVDAFVKGNKIRTADMLVDNMDVNAMSEEYVATVDNVELESKGICPMKMKNIVGETGCKFFLDILSVWDCHHTIVISILMCHSEDYYQLCVSTRRVLKEACDLNVQMVANGTIMLTRLLQFCFVAYLLSQLFTTFQHF